MIHSYRVREEAGLNHRDTDSDCCYLWAVGRRGTGREGHRELSGERRVSCVDEHGSALVKTEYSVCAFD